MPQSRLARIPVLVRQLQTGTAAEQVWAGAGLLLLDQRAGDSKEAVLAAIAEAGGIQALAQLAGSSTEPRAHIMQPPCWATWPLTAPRAARPSSMLVVSRPW